MPSKLAGFVNKVMDKANHGIDVVRTSSPPGSTKQRMGKGLLGFGLLFIVLGVILGFVASEKPGPTEAQRAAGEKTDGQKMSMAAAIMSLIGVASMLAAYYIR